MVMPDSQCVLVDDNDALLSGMTELNFARRESRWWHSQIPVGEAISPDPPGTSTRD